MGIRRRDLVEDAAMLRPDRAPRETYEQRVARDRAETDKLARYAAVRLDAQGSGPGDDAGQDEPNESDEISGEIQERVA